MEIISIAIIISLILSIIVHEVAHGYMADYLGDPTPRYQGRLSLNPLVHIDPIGSILVPGLLFFTNAGILFGWAKPVPYNPYNLSDQRWGEAKVAAAGPGVNLLIAVIFGTLIRLADPLGLSSALVELFSYIVYMNILLALFNLIPFPPLDGSKIIQPFLPFGAQLRYREFLQNFERFGLVGTFLFIFVFVNLFWSPFSRLVALVFSFVTGSSFL